MNLSIKEAIQDYFNAGKSFVNDPQRSNEVKLRGAYLRLEEEINKENQWYYDQGFSNGRICSDLPTLKRIVNDLENLTSVLKEHIYEKDNP